MALAKKHKLTLNHFGIGGGFSKLASPKLSSDDEEMRRILVGKSGG